MSGSGSSSLDGSVVGPSRWSFMSASLAEHLEHVLAERKTIPAELVPGVYSGAIEFLQSALEATREAPPANALVSITNLDIALEAFHRDQERVGALDAAQRLRAFAALLPQLCMEQPLNQSHVKVVEDFKRFLRSLASAGDEEDYVAALG